MNTITITEAKEQMKSNNSQISNKMVCIQLEWLEEKNIDLMVIELKEEITSLLAEVNSFILDLKCGKKTKDYFQKTQRQWENDLRHLDYWKITTWQEHFATVR